MKFVITGAGGGHFYPLIAVAERIRKECLIQKVIQPDLYFFSDQAYDEEALYKVNCKFIQISAGKIRVYPSFETIIDFFRTLYGCFLAIVKLYSIYPDAIFAKGGYASFPTLFAARLLSIPVIVHESDTVPGRTTVWAGGFASRVAVSYEEAARLYPEGKVALTGQPIRDELLPPEDFVRQYPKKNRPVILIYGGSQGSQVINTVILEILSKLLERYDVVHQTGKNNIEAVKTLSDELLKNHEYKNHYFVDGFIDPSLFFPKVDLVITRAGSSMFEMVLWQLPMIVIPIPETISRDQKSNAYAMASRGFATVIEENNLSPSILLSVISQIFDSEKKYLSMLQHTSVHNNSRTAATTIARELIRIGLSHL